MNTTTTPRRWRTTCAYISGSICGHMWMPQSMAGIPGHWDLRAQFDRTDRGTFRDVLNHVLMEKGRDFQDARFSADTVLRVERRVIDGPGKYRLHIWEREVGSLEADLVHAEMYTGDFYHDED